MPKVRYDVSDVEEMGDFTPAPVGLYIMKIKEASAGESKAGQPMGTIVLEIVKDAKGKKIKESYGNIWHRIPLDNSNPGWTPRLLEFIKALGLKPKGVLDLDKIAGEELLVKLRSGKDLDDNYRPEVGKIMQIMDEPAEDESEDEDEDDEDTGTDYSEMKLAELRTEAEDRELDVKAILKGRKTAADKRDALIDALEESDSDEDDEDDEDSEGDEYDDMKKGELVKEARSRGIKIRQGMSQDDIIEALRENDTEEDGEEPDDEDEDEESDDDDSDDEESYDDWDLDDLKNELKERGLKATGSKALLVKRLEKDDESDADPF
jgi:hypothetical protein